MRWPHRLRTAARMLLTRRRESTRLAVELQFHLDQQIAENQSHGMNPEEARRAAMRLFGNPLLVREQSRAHWSFAWLDSLARNLRQAARRLRRSPGFAATAILVMALGIGATTALFTIVRSVMLRPLPFKDPGRLVMLYEHFRQTQPGDDPYNWVAPGDFRDWQSKTHTFTGMAAWRYYGFGLSGEHGGLPESVQAVGASWNLPSLLGIRPALGRSFTASEDQPDGAPVVMLSWGLYQRRFGGNPSILGRQILLDAIPTTVVGVLPRGFAYPNPKIQVWVPYGQTFIQFKLMYASHASHMGFVVARLPRGVSAAAAVAPVSALQYRIFQANPNLPVAQEVWVRPMLADLIQPVQTSLLVLLGAVGCVLLIACLNVSNLLVARGAARRKEIAVRGALGGSRLQLIAEQMTDSLLLSFAGGALGLLLSLAGTHWLAAHWKDLPRAGAVHIDATVVLFVIAVVAFAAFLSGLVPAVSSTRGNVLAALQDSSRSVGGSQSRATLRKALLTAEVALTVLLLIGAGLLFKSFLHLRGTDLGCATNVMTLKYGLPQKQYDTPAKIIAFHQAVLDRVRRLPGVEAAGLVATAPGAGYDGDETFTIPDHPATSFQLQDDAIFRTADPGYFRAMQIPVLRGRAFTAHDTLNNSNVMIISKQFADQFFPHEDPIGRMVSTSWGSINPANFRVVGVVGNTPYDVAQPEKATMYFPILSGLPLNTNSATVVARTAGNPLLAALPMQKAVASIDPQLPVSDVLSMQQIIGTSTAGQSFIATLVVAFAALSLLLAAVGLYGVLSYLVAQRITEIGIRMALGAQRAEVLRLVLFDGLRPVLTGLTLGLAAAAAASALLRSMLYGTSPLDPLVYIAMVAILLLVSTLACTVPALRAAHIDPMQALRAE